MIQSNIGLQFRIFILMDSNIRMYTLHWVGVRLLSAHVCVPTRMCTKVDTRQSLKTCVCQLFSNHTTSIIAFVMAIHYPRVQLRRSSRQGETFNQIHFSWICHNLWTLPINRLGAVVWVRKIWTDRCSYRPITPYLVFVYESPGPFPERISGTTLCNSGLPSTWKHIWLRHQT